MRRIAVVVDFNVSQPIDDRDVDVYVVDRYQSTVTTVALNGVYLDGVEDIKVDEFIKGLQKQYEEVFYLLTTYDTLHVEDFKWKERLNETRTNSDAKVYMYPIHYIRQSKDEVVRFVIEMYEANQTGKEILARVDRITKDQVFSINQLIMCYFMNVYY